MLADFQQAFADMVASPPLCRDVRAGSGAWAERYRLTAPEIARLVAIARQPGMRCNCIVYRANRLAPLALNVPDLCKALGDGLTATVDAFWARHPETNVNFLVECDRFCEFVAAEDRASARLTEEARSALEREHADVKLRLAAILAIL